MGPLPVASQAADAVESRDPGAERHPRGAGLMGWRGAEGLGGRSGSGSRARCGAGVCLGISRPEQSGV